MKQPTIELPKTPAEAAETLYDGKDIQVKFEDGRQLEWVKVRKVPRCEFVKLASAMFESMTQEEAEAAIYVNRPTEWIDALDNDSINAVMQEGRRLNFTPFSAWFERRQQLLKMAKIEATELEKIAKRPI